MRKTLITPLVKSLLARSKGAPDGIDIFPPANKVLRVYETLDPSDVKVVILGQDPYHTPEAADGLAFSISTNDKTQPSLRNIFKELNDDLGIDRKNTDLSDWLEQGVFLLNTTLTVEQGKPGSHKDLGWETFTDETIKYLNEENHPIVFILWGNDAREKREFITNPKHLVIESSHPSPLAARHSFFGSKPFSKTNAYLESRGLTPINWSDQAINNLKG